MKPGIHHILIEQYHSGIGISRSGIMEFMRSPLHYWHEFLNPEKEPEVQPDIIKRSDSLHFGNVFHTYMLERDQFENRYLQIVCPNDKWDMRVKACKDVYAKGVEEAKGRKIVCSKSFADILDMERTINKSASAKNLLTGGLNERSLYWIDSDTNLLCKVRPDVWHSNMIIDIKTSADASPRAFSRDIYQYGYHIQAAMMHEALFALKGVNIMNFIFIVVEKTAPHGTAVYRLDEDAVRFGIEEFKRVLFDMKECIATNEFPSYPDATLDLPAYAYSKKEEF